MPPNDLGSDLRASNEGHIHGGSATTQFFGGSKKYFGTHHAVLSTKSKRDPA